MKQKLTICKILIVFFLYITLAGCVMASPTSLPTVALEKTVTPTPHPESTPTMNVVLEQIIENCVRDDKNNQKLPEGTAVLTTKEHELILLHLLSNQSISLGKTSSLVATSPDLTKLSFIAEEGSILSIVNSGGEHISDIPLSYQKAGVIAWLKENSLIIQPFEQLVDAPRTVAATPVLLNLETGDIQELSNLFPNAAVPAFPPREWGNYSYSETVYDLSFSRAIYLSQDEHSQLILTLYSLENNQILNAFYQQPDPDYGGAPQWSRDGSFFIAGIYPTQPTRSSSDIKDAGQKLPYVGGFELYKVYADGNFKRLTNLTAKYIAGEEQFSLSPDGQSIAFWLNLDYRLRDSSGDRRLALLNVNSGQITNLCFKGGAVPVTPVWSPDGKYLLLTIYDKSQVNPDVYLVGLEQRFVIRVATGKIAQGWLINAP